MERPRQWDKLVNDLLTKKEAEHIRTCIARNRPCRYGEWQDQQAKQLGLRPTLCREGRPKTLKGAPHPKN